MKGSLYCPVCGRTLTAINTDDVESGEASGYVFVHDEIPHSDEDMAALERGIQ